MDLSDVMDGLLDGCAGLGSAMPEKPKLSKAALFYDEICAYIGQKASGEAKSPIIGNLLRASGMADVFKQLTTLKMASSREDINSVFTKIPDVGAQLTFDVGHALHDWWREDYFGPMGRLYGDWMCLACGIIEKGTNKSVLKDACKADGRAHGPLKFNETYIENLTLRYRGHPDGELIFDGEAKPSMLLEIKTASTSSWEGLSGPTDDHIIQVHPYMHALGYTETMFVYIDKGKQTDWKHIDGKLTPVGKPRFKCYVASWNEEVWAMIKSNLSDLWEIWDRLPEKAA